MKRVGDPHVHLIPGERICLIQEWSALMGWPHNIVGNRKQPKDYEANPSDAEGEEREIEKERTRRKKAGGWGMRGKEKGGSGGKTFVSE